MKTMPSIETVQQGRKAWVQRRIEAGELVSNAPFRERIEFLQAHDPEFSQSHLCLKLADNGYPKFAKPQRPTSRHRKGRITGDTSHLQRLLGMRDQSSCLKNGKRYQPPKRTEWIEYDMAVALCRALEMWPCDCGV